MPIAGNTGSLGISLAGNFSEGDEVTKEQKEALKALLRYLNSHLPNIGCIAGHGDVNSGNELANSSIIKDVADEFGWNFSATACYKAR